MLDKKELKNCYQCARFSVCIFMVKIRPGGGEMSFLFNPEIHKSEFFDLSAEYCNFYKKGI